MILPSDSRPVKTDAPPRGYLNKARLHLNSVRETWFQHSRMSFGFARKMAAFAARCLWCGLTKTPVAGSALGRDMKELARTMAARNPAALAEAMTMAALKENQIGGHMARAALCAALHAALPGWHRNSASVYLIRAVRGLDADCFRT